MYFTIWNCPWFVKFTLKKNHEETIRSFYIFEKWRKLMGTKFISVYITTTNSETCVYSPHVVRHKIPNYVRSFFRVCVMPTGVRPRNSVRDECARTRIRNTSKIRRCRYRPLGNHLARIATYGIMKVRRTRQGARWGARSSEGGRGEKKRMEGTGLARCGARPGVSLISWCFSLFPSHLLTYLLLFGTCNLIVSNLTFDASKQLLLFIGRSWDHGVNKR